MIFIIVKFLHLQLPTDGLKTMLQVAMEENMLGALLVTDVHRKSCIKWWSHESYGFRNQLLVKEDMRIV